ncbi:MAG: mechanosensitive ion channel [Gammaproteobacteria bacterium]|nr:mechanosensitive ion channel [Gammaproteobacteria bacterium]
MPVIAVAIISVILLWLMNWFLLGRNRTLGSQARLPRQLIMFVLTVMSLLVLIILFPMTDSTRGQIITLLGLVITGVIALASTTFVANVMAGLMLNVVKSFSPGDFIRVGEQFGRVTERGLFHIEIQTEDRDLATLPNLHLATNPVTVVHKAGTIISAELSLGYDVPRIKIEELLKEAALKVDLVDPFVLVISLNDFSVVYRVSGFLADVTSLITARSNLKKYVLDVMHDNDIEIVSPSFMYQRQMPSWDKVIPKAQLSSAQIQAEEEIAPEEMIFDKATGAAELEDIRAQIEALVKKTEKMKKKKKTASADEKIELDKKIELASRQIEELSSQLEKKDDAQSEDEA